MSQGKKKLDYGAGDRRKEVKVDQEKISKDQGKDQ